MSKKGIIFILLILAAGSAFTYFVFYNLKEAGYESCVLSIESAFGQALSHQNSALSREIVINDEWRTLNEEEERILFDKFISIGRTFDCKQFSEYANGEALRGDKGKINVRRDGQRVLVRVEVKDARSRIYY